jgi:hypothetical protein
VNVGQWRYFRPSTVLWRLIGFSLMKKRYDQLTALLVAIIITLWAISKVRYLSPNPTRSAHVILMTAHDPETVFALGLRLPLGCTDQWAIELIPKLSNRVAQAVIKNRTEIIKDAARKTPEEALKAIYGVGDATAQQLIRYLKLSDNCFNIEPDRQILRSQR